MFRICSLKSHFRRLSNLRDIRLIGHRQIHHYLLTMIGILSVILGNVVFYQPLYSQEPSQLEEPKGQIIDFLSDLSDTFGYLTFATNIDSFYVFINKDPKTHKSVTKHDTLKLSAGLGTLTIASPANRDHTIEIYIRQNTITEYSIEFMGSLNSKGLIANSSYPRFQLQANLVIVTDKESFIFIDGNRVGQNYIRIDTLAATYLIQTKHQYAGNSKKTVHVKSDRLEIVEMFNKPHRSITFALGLVPGLSQYYLGQKLKGTFLFTATTAVLGLAYKYQQDFNSNNSSYNVVRSIYQLADSEQKAVQLGDEAEALFNLAKQSARKRDIFFGTFISIYIINIIDVLKPPESGYRDERKHNLMPLIQNNTFGWSYKFSF